MIHVKLVKVNFKVSASRLSRILVWSRKLNTNDAILFLSLQLNLCLLENLALVYHSSVLPTLQVDFKVIQIKGAQIRVCVTREGGGRGY